MLEVKAGRGKREPRDVDFLLSSESGNCTFCLAVGAVLVVFLSEHFGQDGLVLLVEFLGLLSLRAGRHSHGFSWTF